MSYTTEFQGELTFTKELATSDIEYLNTILGEDVRDHYADWPRELWPDAYYIDLELTEDFSGLVWDASEKTQDMVGIINLILGMLRKEKIDVGLEGTLLAQGEEMDDRYEIRIVNGRAEQKELPVLGDRITCPHCEGTFILK